MHIQVDIRKDGIIHSYWLDPDEIGNSAVWSRRLAEDILKLDVANEKSKETITITKVW